MHDLTWILGGFGIKALLLSSLLIALHLRHKKRYQHLQKTGIQLLLHCRTLLGCMQQHRGLTTGFINGEEGLKSDIDNLQRHIQRLTTGSSMEAEALSDDEGWLGMIDHWARVSKLHQASDSATNFEQHNQLIKNMLYLIDDIAQRHHLMHLSSPTASDLVLFWRDVLSTTEMIGQARAIGMGVTARHQCDSVERIRLNYLSDQIELTTKALCAQVKGTDDLRPTVAALLNCIRSDITNDRPSATPSQYFSRATTPINALFKLFDEQFQGHLRANP